MTPLLSTKEVAARQHPKDERGKYRPLFDGSTYAGKLAEYEAELAAWGRGGIRDYATNGWRPREAVVDALSCASFDAWYGERPDPADFMPAWPPEEATKLVMYEDTTEGTPISPAFDTPEELARWLADNGASRARQRARKAARQLRRRRGKPAVTLTVAGVPRRTGVFPPGWYTFRAYALSTVGESAAVVSRPVKLRPGVCARLMLSSVPGTVYLLVERRPPDGVRLERRAFNFPPRGVMLDDGAPDPADLIWCPVSFLVNTFNSDTNSH